MKTIYICSDTITGIFSGIYDAWKAGKTEQDCGITFLGAVEQELFFDYVEVEESERKAQAVERLIRKHMGMHAYWDIFHAVLSPDRDKGNAVLGTMMAARKLPDGRKIMDHLSHPMVEKVFELSRTVAGEAHLLKGFLRFQELESGILYAQITPKAQVLSCLAPHFEDRLPNENWMIHDKSHRMFAVHEAGKHWVLVLDEYWNEDRLLPVSEKEKEYTKLWKNFCQTIAIQSRMNPRCQMQHLPLRFRPNMTEFQ